MAEEMRLKEIVGTNVVVSLQKLTCNVKLNNETNSNDLLNPDDNCTNIYCHQWSNCTEFGDDKKCGDDNSFHESHQITSNNNIAIDREEQRGYRHLVNCSSPVSSPEDDSYGDYEEQSSSSLDVSPQGDEYHCFSQEEITDSDFSDDGNHYPKESYVNRGIVNPNYPGFQGFANDLEDSDDDEIGCNLNNNTNSSKEVSESVNHLDSVENFQKAFYDKPKFDIVNCREDEHDSKQENSDGGKLENGESRTKDVNLARPSSKDNLFGDPPIDSGVSSGVTTDNEFECPEAFLDGNWFVQEDIVTTTVYPVSGVFETAIITDDESDSSLTEEKEETEVETEATTSAVRGEDSCCREPCEISRDKARKAEDSTRDSNKLEKEEKERETEEKKSPNESPTGARGEKKVEQAMKKEEKTQINVTTKYNFKVSNKTEVTDHVSYRGCKESPRINARSRRPLPLTKEKGSNLDLGFFDVYNIETAMPKIDIEAIESHLKAAKEEERRETGKVGTDCCSDIRRTTKKKAAPGEKTSESEPIFFRRWCRRTQCLKRK